MKSLCAHPNVNLGGYEYTNMVSAGSRTSQATFKHKIQLSRVLKVGTSTAIVFTEEKGSLCFETINVEICPENVPTNCFHHIV